MELLKKDLTYVEIYQKQIPEIRHWDYFRVFFINFELFHNFS